MFIKNGNEVNYEFFTQLMLYSLLQKRRDNEKKQHNCLQEVLYMKNESGNGFLTPTLFNVRNESENRPPTPLRFYTAHPSLLTLK